MGGVPEIVQNATAGRVVAERTPEAFAAALQDLLAARNERSRVRQYAEGFSWDRTSQDQLSLFNALAARA